MIKASIRIAVLWAAFFSFHLFANEDTPWIPPDYDEKRYYVVSGVRYENIEEWCGIKDGTISGAQYYNRQGPVCTPNTIIAGVREGWTFTFSYTNSVGTPNLYSTYVEAIIFLDITAECRQLDYPLGEDVNFDGTYDHCHASQCDRNGEMFENPGLIGPYVCIAQGNGEYCEHEIGNVQNADGSVGISIIAPTGESCGSDPEGIEHDPWVPLEENDLPDPTDPNSPPSDDGNPDCTPIDGSGLNICSAIQGDVCTNGVCPDNCGTVNGNFVCITEDGGGDATVDPVDDINDNSDNQGTDDPNTAGDEGTHSRLDGLLKNTDGIEGLLQGIKDAIGDIPGGGGDSSEDPGEEEPHCTGGQFYIGETCISFDKNDKPVNSDLDFASIDQSIADAESELMQKYNEIKTALSSKFNLSLTGGVYTANVQTVKGTQVDFGLARLSALFNFSLWGGIVMLIFGIRSMFVLVGG